MTPEINTLSFEVPPSIRIVSVDETYADALYELVQRNTAHLQVYLPKVVTTIHSAETARQHIRRSQQLALAGELLEFHLFYEGALCGAVRLNNFEPENKKVAIAYFLGKEFEGRGIVTKACRPVIAYCFEQMGFNRIELRCVTTNQGSIRIAGRLGFVLEGELRQAELLDQGYVNHFVYGLLKDDFQGKNST